MDKLINFIIIQGEENVYGYYEDTIRSIVDPIRLHLPESQISQRPLINAINIHFFLEEDYFNICDPSIGTSVFMSHGIADKHWRDGERVRPFQYICVSGPLWKEKMLREGIQEEQILMVGYSKLDPIFHRQIPESNSSRKRILWAPTHNSSTPSSYPKFLEYMPLIPSEYEFISSPHPFHNKKIPTLEKLVNADVVISDTSSLIYEAWAIGKPVIFPDWLVKPLIPVCFPHSFEDIIYEEKIGYHAETIEELIHLISVSIRKGLGKREIEFIEKILPASFRGTSGEETAKQLMNLAKS